MLAEATLEVSGTFLGEAIRLLILFAAQQTPPKKGRHHPHRSLRTFRVVL